MSANEDFRSAGVQGFESDYGIDPNSAGSLFKPGSALPIMLQHMYLNTMDALRDCNIEMDGVYIQARAKLLWELLSIPNEIETMNEE